MNKLAIVYNICGITRENTDEYIKSLHSILEQKNIDKHNVVVSSCKNNVSTREILQNEFGNKINYNFIDDTLPVNVTFNHSCLLAKEKFGDFDGYLYLDSGITLPNDSCVDQLSSLINDDIGMIASQVDTDGGYHQWFGLGNSHQDHSQTHQLFKNGDFVIPIGKALNLHCQIFTKKIMDYYGYLFPDIFASYCSESVFTFVCAAIKTKWILSKDVLVNHIHGMDLGSSGFNPIHWARSGRQTWDHPFFVDSVINRIVPGQTYGLGYEECQRIVMHDPSCYDENGFCTNEDLKKYIKDNLFIGNLGFKYEDINHTWI